MKMDTSKKVHYDSGPNMTPLVDIVMVILIFLMLTGTFTGATHFLQANLPITKGGERAIEGGNTMPQDARIEVRVDGVGDEMFAYIGRAQPIQSDEALVGALRHLRKTFLDQGKRDDEIQVIIYPGRLVKYQTVMRVFSAATRAELQKVAFGTSH